MSCLQERLASDFERPGWIGVVLSLGIFFIVSYSSSACSEAVFAEETDPVDSIITEFIDCHPASSSVNQIECSYYARSNFIAILYNEENWEQGGVKFNSLAQTLENSRADASNRYIFLHGDRIFELFDESDIKALSDDFEAGSPVGTSAKSEQALSLSLGLEDVHNQVAGDSTGKSSVHFLHRRIIPATLLSPALKLTDHLEIGLDLEQPYSTILGRIIDWQEKNVEASEVEISANTSSSNDANSSSRTTALDLSSGS